MPFSRPRLPPLSPFFTFSLSGRQPTAYIAHSRTRNTVPSPSTILCVRLRNVLAVSEIPLHGFLVSICHLGSTPFRVCGVAERGRLQLGNRRERQRRSGRDRVTVPTAGRTAFSIRAARCVGATPCTRRDGDRCMVSLAQARISSCASPSARAQTRSRDMHCRQRNVNRSPVC